MNLNIIKSLFAIIFILGAQHLYAQDDYVAPPVDPIRKPYKFTDNLFYGFNLGTSYSMSSFVSEESPIKMLRPTLDAYIGKNFTKAIAARVSAGYHFQAGSIGNEAMDKIYEYYEDEEFYNSGPSYSMHMLNIAADLKINMNRVFGQKREDPKFKFSILGGVGLNTVFGYSPKTKEFARFIDFNRSVKAAPEFHAGVELGFRASEKSNFNIQFTWHHTTSNYNGLSTVTGGRRYIELSIGFSKRLPNRYASYRFENCRGNEKYYFNLDEDKILKEYHKIQKKEYKKTHIPPIQLPSENDSILTFPHTYAYLTPRQSAKLEKMVEHLRQNPHLVAVINIYPHATSKDDMSLEQSVDRCKDEISTITYELWSKTKVDDNTSEMPPVRYVTHNKEYSPIKPDGIWFHNAFISYENK